jgi:hypothetical protein
LFKGIEHIVNKERNSVIRAAQRYRAKSFRIKVANCRALVVNFYSHIPISKKDNLIEDVISEKQIKFSSNLQDEAAVKDRLGDQRGGGE